MPVPDMHRRQDRALAGALNAPLLRNPEVLHDGDGKPGRASYHDADAASSAIRPDRRSYC
jgi:hypothetical protein